MEEIIATNQPRQNTVAFILEQTILWFKYLMRKWWVIAIVGLLGGIYGVTKTWLTDAKYESHLTFALEDNGGGLDGALNLAAEFGFNIGGNNKNIFSGENILAILTSRRIVESVLLSVDTVDGKPITMADYLININNRKNKPETSKKKSRLDGVHFPVGQPRSQFSYLQDSVLYVQYMAITKFDLNVAKPDKKLNLYEVNFISKDERYSKIFTEKLVSRAIDFYTELKTKRSLETIRVLEARTNFMKNSAKGAMDNRANIQDADVNPAFAKQTAQLQKQQLDMSAYGGAYGELFKNLELARYQYLKDVPLLQIIDAPSFPLKNLKEGRLKTGLIYAVIFSIFAIMFLIGRKFIKDSLNDRQPTL